ncbi:MAG TPA: alpha/beta fold hydrolase [Thermoanaerobaculia bacterium]|nr:alpha/beta fold hydrolase [Thermoanaerobaculia bacterium]
MIVWIHGFPLSSAVFAKQPPGFAPDLAGFGSAPAPAGQYSMDDYARDILAAMDAQGIDRAVVAGLSMGGYVCFAIARLAPERIRGLILIDTRETPDDADGKKGRFDMILKVKEQGVPVVVESMLPKMLTSEAPRELVDEAQRIMITSSPLGVITALRAMADRPDSTETLRGLDVPALAVAGDHDTITPPSDAERMAKLLPNGTAVTIRGAAHLSNLEQPEQFNEAVESFLKRNGL